jgi:hypothetical protein
MAATRELRLEEIPAEIIGLMGKDIFRYLRANINEGRKSRDISNAPEFDPCFLVLNGYIFHSFQLEDSGKIIYNPTTRVYSVFD